MRSDSHPSGEQPLISVIVPAYNVAPFVAEAIESLLGQCYRTLEIIIVDDGSTDDTYRICAAIAARDDRVILLRNQRNQGIVHSLNHALDVANGDYVARMDGDDVAMPDRMAHQLAYLRDHPEIDLVGCSFLGIDEAGRTISRKKYISDTLVLRKNLRLISPVLHIWLCRKDLYDKVGPYRLAGVEDYDFLLRMDSLGFTFSNVPDYIGMKIRYRQGNTTHSMGLRQRRLADYARMLHQRRARGEPENYSENSAAAYADGAWRIAKAGFSAANRVLAVTAGRANRSALTKLGGYAAAALISPDYARYFWRQLRARVSAARHARFRGA